MAKFLVTGGAGFIGSYLVNFLGGLGFDVAALDALCTFAWPPSEAEYVREKALRRALISDATFARIDLLDQARITHWLVEHQPEVIIHLAANPILGSAGNDPRACERDIVGTTRNLLNAIRATGTVRRLVYVSSSMVYGNFVNNMVDEDSPTAPVNSYGQLKLAAEHLVRQLAKDDGVEVTIIRPMAVYGAGDFYRRVIPVFCAQALVGDPLTIKASADVLIDFSYVEDIAKGLTLAALEPAAAGETFNLAYGQARSLHDVFLALKRHFPQLRYEVIASTGVQRPNRGTLDISKARKLLDFDPRVSLEEGIERCVAFLQRADADADATHAVVIGA